MTQDGDEIVKECAENCRKIDKDFKDARKRAREYTKTWIKLHHLRKSRGVRDERNKI